MPLPQGFRPLGEPAGPRLPTGFRRVQTNLLEEQGITGEEVKRRAAAGEPIVQEGLHEPSPWESVASGTAELAAGAGEGLGQILAIPADIATAGPRMGAATVNALRKGGGIQGARDASMDELTRMPSTSLVHEASRDAAQTFKGWLGVDPGAITDVGDYVNNLAGQVAVPLPEVVAGRAALAPKFTPGEMRAAGAADNVATPDGMVRMYHGGLPYDQGSRWLTPSLDDAEGWARKTGDGAVVQYVDIPEGSPLLAKSFDDEGASVKSPYLQFEASQDIASQLRPVTTNGAVTVPPPSAPTLTAAPQPYRSPDDLWTKIRENVEDDWVRVKKLVNEPGVKVTEESDPYTAEILYHGRLGARAEEAKDLITTIDQDVINTSRKLGLRDADLQRDVDRFLHARHTPERNASVGPRAAGMSDEEASGILSEIQNSPHGAEVQRIADQLQDINNRTLDVLREGEVISDDLYSTLREKYKAHVPLNRIMDDVEDVGSILASRPYDVKSSGIIRAKGSERQVSDITTNILANYEQAILRAEKNRVMLAVRKFANDNPDLGLFKEIRRKAIGKTFDDQGVILESANDITRDPQVLTMREKGEPVFLRVNDPALAVAFHGLNRYKVDGWLKPIAAYSRMMSGLATRFNPEFFLPNKLRDIQEATVYAFSKGELGAKGALRAAVGDRHSVADVLNAIRRKDTPGARLYWQMKQDGGTTGGLGLSTRQQISLDVEKIRQTNRSAPRKAAREVFNFIDHVNTVFEDSTRLSIYRAAIERGASRQQAARMAKEASVNFNKFGRGGPQLNALYMFANASIQGSAKMLRAMRNPKVAGAVTAAVATAVGVTSEWNDKIDPDWRKKVSEGDRLTSLVVMLPPDKDGTADYIKIPVSWGIKPIKVAFDHIADAMYGHGKSPGDSVKDIVAATIEAYNPVGGTDLGSALTPTAFDLPLDIARNRKWHGGPIKPNPREPIPESVRYFESLNKTLAGRTAIRATDALAGVGIEISPADVVYAYESLVGGSGKAATRLINTINSIGRGESPSVNEVPVINRFVEEVTPEQIRQREESARRKMETEQNKKIEGEIIRAERRARGSAYPHRPGAEWPKDPKAKDENAELLLKQNPSLLLPERFKNGRTAVWGTPVSGEIPLPGFEGARGGFGIPFDKRSGPLPRRTVQITKVGRDEAASYTHELGHVVYFGDLTENERTAWKQRFVDTVNKYIAESGSAPDDSAKKAAWAKHPQAILRYAGEYPNDRERAYAEGFAEMFGQYMANPTPFKKTYPEMYQYFRNLIGKEFIQGKNAPPSEKFGYAEPASVLMRQAQSLGDPAMAQRFVNGKSMAYVQEDGSVVPIPAGVAIATLRGDPSRPDNPALKWLSAMLKQGHVKAGGKIRFSDGGKQKNPG